MAAPDRSLLADAGGSASTDAYVPAGPSLAILTIPATRCSMVTGRMTLAPSGQLNRIGVGRKRPGKAAAHTSAQSRLAYAVADEVDAQARSQSRLDALDSITPNDETLRYEVANHTRSPVGLSQYSRGANAKQGPAVPDRSVRSVRSETEPGLDTYQGATWSERAALGPLRSGLDPGDVTGRRNRHIDRVQRLALRWALRPVARPGMALIDFGCGSGRMFEELVATGSEVWGTDRNAVMLGAARALDVVPPERIFLWDADAAADPPAVFDVITTVGVALTPTLLAAVVEAIEALAKAGAVVVMLEQLDRRRGLTMAEYERALHSIGYRVERWRLVRRGTRSPMLALSSRVPLPGWIASTAARVEWRAAPALGVPAGGYGDVILVARAIDG